MLNKCSLGAILNPRASISTHLNYIFSPGGSKWCNPVIEGGTTPTPTWSRLGSENAPRMHLDRSGSFFNRFWKDFGQIRDRIKLPPISFSDKTSALPITPHTCVHTSVTSRSQAHGQSSLSRVTGASTGAGAQSGDEDEEEPFEEEDTQDAPVSVAQNPYASPISDPRALINALSKLGEQQ